MSSGVARAESEARRVEGRCNPSRTVWGVREEEGLRGRWVLKPPSRTSTHDKKTFKYELYDGTLGPQDGNAEESPRRLQEPLLPDITQQYLHGGNSLGPHRAGT